MPTFGQTGNQGSSSASTADKTAVSVATPGSSGTVDSATARVFMSGGSTLAKFCIYADNAGEPGAKLAESNQITISNTTEQAINFPFSGVNRINIVSGTPYWIGPSWLDPGTDTLSISRGTTTAGRREVASYAPNPFGTSSVLTGPIDAYVDYLLPVSSSDDGGFFEFFEFFGAAAGAGSDGLGLAPLGTAPLGV
jgi:hypothetical protein